MSTSVDELLVHLSHPSSWEDDRFFQRLAEYYAEFEAAMIVDITGSPLPSQGQNLNIGHAVVETVEKTQSPLSSSIGSPRHMPPQATTPSISGNGVYVEDSLQAAAAIQSQLITSSLRFDDMISSSMGDSADYCEEHSGCMSPLDSERRKSKLWFNYLEGEKFSPTDPNGPFHDKDEDIFPPRAPVDNKTSPVQSVTPALAKLVDDPNLKAKYAPAVVCRETWPEERGRWRLKTDDWSLDLQIRFWEHLEAFVGRGLAGWGVSCYRFGREAKLGLVEVYCWGDAVEHTYLLLWQASNGKIGDTNAEWVDVEDKVVLKVL